MREALLCVNWAPTRLVLVIINYHWMSVLTKQSMVAQNSAEGHRHPKMSACDDSANEWMSGPRRPLEVKHKGSVVMLLTSHFLSMRAPIRDACALSSSVGLLNSFDVDSEQLLLLFLSC